MLKLSSLMIGSEDPKELAAFYEKVLEKKPDMSDGDWSGWSVGGCYLTIGGHDKVKGKSTNPERLIFNLETDEVKSEFERIKALGATVIKAPYQMDPTSEKTWLCTFADLEGNFFQLTQPWEG